MNNNTTFAALQEGEELSKLHAEDDVGLPWEHMLSSAVLEGGSDVRERLLSATLIAKEQ